MIDAYPGFFEYDRRDDKRSGTSVVILRCYHCSQEFKELIPNFDIYETLLRHTKLCYWNRKHTNIIDKFHKWKES